MEYRKLISFGKSSYVVSLPKSWVIQNKLKKGDLIYFEDSSNDLLLQARPNTEGEKEKEITINIDKKDLRRIQREIIAAYIQNYKTIILEGEEIKTKAQNIQRLIENLVALEVLEQDSKKMVAKDFLNLNDISLDQILRKMDVITRSMLKDCKEMFNEDNSDSIHHRDNDVNKFRFLIFRIVWFGMENPSLILKKLKLKQRDLLNYWWLAFSVEAIADYIKRISKYMRDIKLGPDQRQEFLRIFQTIDFMYHEIMKAYYTKNQEIAHKILNERFKVLQWLDDFEQKNRNIPLIGNLAYNTKSLLVTTHAIGRIVYEGMPG